MKAVIYKKYGPPEVAQLVEIPQPVPASNEVLIKVYASTVNRTDSGFRSAEYFISRFWSGLFRPKYQTLGCEFAGVIESTGSDVTTFKKGDRVFGFNDKTCGGHAEYLTTAADGAIALIPENYDFETAAAFTEGAHYALCDIRSSGIQKGQHALVYGATGAIGSAAVQLLKYFGVHVTAVCNTKSVELVRSLGADVVIDYQTEDFTKTSQRFELVFDAVGKSSFGACKPLMTKKGKYVSTELGKNAENIYLALFTPLFGGKKVIFPIPTMNKEMIDFLKDRVENGDFKPVIDRTYRLEEIVEAYKYVETGQKTGNVILKIVD
ncbi:MAG: NAD(P)-dependent alcohol dehydrogenase [Crocinitomicaceae bacterium]|nr:NAD(P)-dependent alcohol dehydrogenase [Crocinitomicaceae bacterium]NGF74500.1 NAD(P)-dependent alcohol dehydrogenase [Fluviicola sp. SGL-29]